MYEDEKPRRRRGEHGSGEEPRRRRRRAESEDGSEPRHGHRRHHRRHQKHDEDAYSAYDEYDADIAPPPPPKMPIRPASPRVLRPDLLLSPQPSARTLSAEMLGGTSSAVGNSSAAKGQRRSISFACDGAGAGGSAGDDDDDDGCATGNTATPSASVEGTSTADVLRQAAARAMERQASGPLGGGASVLERAGVGGAKPPAGGGGRGDGDGDDDDNVEFKVDADGNFRFVPARRGPPAPVTRAEPANELAIASSLAKVGGRCAARACGQAESMLGIKDTGKGSSRLTKLGTQMGLLLPAKGRTRTRGGKAAPVGAAPTAAAAARAKIYGGSSPSRRTQRRGGTPSAAAADAASLHAFASANVGREAGAPTHGRALFFYNLQRTPTFSLLVLLCVLASAYFLATEYPVNIPKRFTYTQIEMGLNAAFTLEFVIKYCAFGRSYFKSNYNRLDFSVVFIGWAIFILEVRSPNISQYLPISHAAPPRPRLVREM